MKQLMQFIALVILFASCQKEENRCQLLGEFESGMNGEFTIYPYQQVSSKEEADKYTVKIPVVDGKFSAYIDSTLAARNGAIKMNGKYYSVNFFSEPGTIKFTLVNDKVVVTGGPNNIEYEEIKETLQYNAFSKLKYKKELTAEEEQIVKSYDEKLAHLTETKPASVPLSKFVWDKYWSADAETLKRIIDRFNPEVQKTYYLTDLNKRYTNSMKTAIGQPAPVFTLNKLNGEELALESFKGKYVLIDFWASWCGPCRAGIPQLKEIYTAFNPKGLELLSLSTDADKNAWIKAMEEEAMPWHQIRDTKDVSDQYNITFIPQIMLISPEGIIVAKNLHGDAIWEALAEVGFKKKS